ncbi:MAG: glycine cleavage system protein GcvH [Candidatus Bathyarchaeia archaeon]
MKVGEYEVVEGLYYTKEHEWLKIEGELCRIGLCDYAQKSLHEIVFVDLPKVGAKATQMQSIGSVESVKAVSDLYSPFSGKIIEVNDELSSHPEYINQDPYGKGWIAKLEIKDDNEKKKLMNSESYELFVKEESGK